MPPVADSPLSRRRLTPIAPWPAADSLAAHVRAEQIRLVFQQAPPAQLLSIVAVGLVCYVLRGVTDTGRLVAWFIVVTAVTLGRIALALAFRRRNPEAAEMREWEVVFVASLGIVSLAWGVGGWLVMPSQSPVHQAVVFFFLMGVAGGAVASYSAHATAVTVAVCALMVPATIGFALQDQLPLRAMAIGGVIYILAAVRSTRTFGFFLRRTFQLQFELHQGYAYAREQARTDDLTGLANRRAFVEQGRMALDQARRYERPLSLIMFDIDHFKKINDSHGHAAGDEALRRVATVVRAAARASDGTGRMGGEEFAVLLPETSIVEAEVLAERLRRDMADLRVEFGGVTLRITGSFGVAEHTAQTADFESLLRAADAALYVAKERGRDRVVGA